MLIPGKFLPVPKLRFDASSPFAVETNPSRGIRRFGPYDHKLYRKKEISCAIVYPKSLEGYKELLCNSLINGEGIFSGFKSWFRVPLIVKYEIPVASESVHYFRSGIKRLLQQGDDLDLVVVLISRYNKVIYRECKAILLANGIPNQVITVEKLSVNKGRQWTISNIALGIYAKTGGTPWVVADTNEGYDVEELIIGVSRAMEPSGRYLVGFVTLFNQDGDFLFMNSQAPVIEWDKYIEGLKGMILETMTEYSEFRGIPDVMILHFQKRPGSKREVKAVKEALDELGWDIPYALVHLNRYSSFRVFDTTFSTYVPKRGLELELGRRQSLLLLDGRDERNRRYKPGVPHVFEIVLDKHSTVNINEFPRLVRQIYNFSFVNWRGFNALSIPVTLNYSYWISRIIAEIGIENWNSLVSSGKLVDKAWFL